MQFLISYFQHSVHIRACPRSLPPTCNAFPMIQSTASVCPKPVQILSCCMRCLWEHLGSSRRCSPGHRCHSTAGRSQSLGCTNQVEHESEQRGGQGRERVTEVAVLLRRVEVLTGSVAGMPQVVQVHEGACHDAQLTPQRRALQGKKGPARHTTDDHTNAMGQNKASKSRHLGTSAVLQSM